MLKIAHTESSMNLGGQELRILEQIRWLRENGHSAWLLARKGAAIYKEALERKLPVVDLPFRGSVNPKAVLAMARFAQRENIDLIDCHSSRDASTVLTTRLLGTPVVRTHHVSGIRHDFLHRLTWVLGNDRIISVSNQIADQLVKRGLSAGKEIDIIGTGIDLDRFRPEIDGRPVRQAYGIPESAKLITLIGMIRPDKGQQYLVRAVDRIVERVPEARFFIVGSPTRPEYLVRLEQEVARVNHKDRITLPGFQKNVEQFIAASDVIVVASAMEGRPQVVAQAFAMKKIVVASDAGGTPELVKPGERGFLYHVGDTAALAQLVAEAVRSDVSRQVENAYAFAQANLGFEQMMTATLRSYRRVLGS